MIALFNNLIKWMSHSQPLPVAMLILGSLSASAQSALSISEIKCENQSHAVGVPLENFRLSWNLESGKKNQQQSAYEIQLSLKAEFNKADIVWNSGRISSPNSIQVMYEGKKLLPGERYFWRVRVWDTNNKPSGWSKQAQFITGIFDESNWSNAQWIAFEDISDSMLVIPGIHAPGTRELGNRANARSIVPLFRTEVRPSSEISEAFVFVTGLGQYELDINGKKVGESFLSPGWTDYDKKCLYNIYDVTGLLTSGPNAIGITVGNGFFNINRERYYKFISVFGTPRLRFKLKLKYKNGATENFVSNGNWKTSASPITFSSIFGGEDYDARVEQRGWNLPGFNDSSWKNVLIVKPPKGRLVPEKDYPVRFMDTIAVRKISKVTDTIVRYDFGQNASGIVSLRVKGKRGQTIKLFPAELVNKDGLAYQAASGDPYYFTYTLKGDGEEEWQPKFTYYGFRYVLAEGVRHDVANGDSELPDIINMSLLHNRNATLETGSFESSDTLFNKINELIRWAIKSNMQSVITDCPHREKLSWLEQDHLMGGSIHYNYDIYNLYKKIVHDMIDAQRENGLVPDIAPELVVFEGGFLDSPEWGSASVILPWLVYRWYGDEALLKEAYPMMKKYVSYLETKANNHILSHGLGDWYDYGPKPPGVAQLTPKALTATAIYYYDLSLMQKVSTLLNLPDDAKTFEALRTKVKNAFNQKFFDNAKQIYSTGSQTAMALPLCVGLVDDQAKDAVVQNLVKSIRESNNALTAGDIGFHFLVTALAENGQSEVIFDMNARDDVPGYGFQLKRGATALTESWPALENVSNNHLMLGHIMEWFYEGLAGISQEETSIAYKKIIIRPNPVGNIKSAKASFKSPYGVIKSEWTKSANSFMLNVEIPVNAEATIFLPSKKGSTIFESGKKLSSAGLNATHIGNERSTLRVKSGKYFFEVKD